MLHPSKTRLSGASPVRVARQAKRQLAAKARPVGDFDARRYFRDPGHLGFHNVGTPAVRRMAKDIVRAHAERWRVADALAFAEALITDRHLEAKGLGLEVLAAYKRECAPHLLPIWKRWLAKNYASNWATTDTLCGMLIGPLVVAHPRLIPVVAGWRTHSNLWVRRASAVGLLNSIRRGAALDAAYLVARDLHSDKADLVQKAVGWMLREAGKIDATRLERYLLANGPSIPRTTVRYAIERFSQRKRRTLLKATVREP
jgi:3-methyladenine DNA glycosylase AlkD